MEPGLAAIIRGIRESLCPLLDRLAVCARERVVLRPIRMPPRRVRAHVCVRACMRAYTYISRTTSGVDDPYSTTQVSSASIGD